MDAGYWPGRADRDRPNVYMYWYIMGSTVAGKSIFRSPRPMRGQTQVRRQGQGHLSEWGHWCGTATLARSGVYGPLTRMAH